MIRKKTAAFIVASYMVMACTVSFADESGIQSIESQVISIETKEEYINPNEIDITEESNVDSASSTEFKDIQQSEEVVIEDNTNEISNDYSKNTIIKLASLIHVDVPTNNGRVQKGKDKVEIRGWSLQDGDIDRIEVHVDGIHTGDANYGLPRVDVAQVYPQYNQSNSGYSYILDTSKLKEGNHKITVKSISVDGEEVSSNINIYVEKMESLIYIDNPRNYSNSNEKIDISGWALQDGGVSKVEVYIDGKPYIGAEYGLSRPDVIQAYKNYGENDKVGFISTIDISNLTIGEHVITVKSTSNNGDISNSSVNIYKGKLKPLVYIDTPSNYSNSSNGQIEIRGWALQGDEVSKVEVYVDGKLHVGAEYGLSRPDVVQAYKYYSNNDRVGYRSIIGLSAGEHVVTIRSTSKSGEVSESSINVYSGKLNPLVFIDTPSNYSNTNNGHVEIKGWALQSGGVNKVEVYVDGKRYIGAEYGLSRADVVQKFKYYSNNDKVGYRSIIDISKLNPGNHTITIRSTSNTGEVSESSVIVNYTYQQKHANAIAYMNNNRILSDTSYAIYTSLSDKMTYVFQGAVNNWNLLYAWACDIGTPSTPTIKGEFKINGRKPGFGDYKSYWVKYATRIYGGYYYHSILFNVAGTKIIDKTLDDGIGDAVSHGCIRLLPENAKWIYENINDRTKVIIR